MTADERIIALADPDSIAQIPSFLRKHAIECSCRLIARDHPDIYEAFSGDGEPDDEAKLQMQTIINDIITDRIKNHKSRGESA